ncbi:MAG: sensor histidine kinase [Limimaricola sp.]|uniref:sensor histidine kinase n=1 Tax=Limimaricola sp. TaxID=2211665 RepID=UPI001DB0F405|nr:HAMP domain-containing sensor histidine kinase [Limimaricola sp.]MBI1418972.1 sensor histidine kinase [Limimaricola sp.]
MQAAASDDTAVSYSDLDQSDLDGSSDVLFLGESPALIQTQMRDYARSGDMQFRQRLIIYVAGLSLAAFYYDPRISIVIGILVVISECLDRVIHRQVFRDSSPDLPTVRRNFALLALSTVLSSSIVVCFTLSIAFSEPAATHFMPLFFLLAGSIFTAMNEGQVVTLLLTRLVLYGAAFVAIPIFDVLRTGAGLHSPEWLELFTSVVVLLFIIKVSQVFLGAYQRQIRQMVELRDLAERARVASTAKTEFLSTVSHELRTPMTSINGAVGIAASGTAGPLTPALERLLGIAQSNCTRLSNLIDDILDLQKIEAGKMVFDNAPIELWDFVERACEVNGPYAIPLDVSFEAVAEHGGQSVVIHGDERRLDQVMSNLLSNAAKFSHPGGVVTVKLTVHEGRARIEVIDRGVGLSEDKRELVFDMFSQVKSSQNRGTAGTGLGMNISKQIVEAHGGTIDYRKNDGPGTTFFFDLPLADD